MIYVSGPMSGVVGFNHKAFNEAARRLRDLGHTVHNPAEQDPEGLADQFPEGILPKDYYQEVLKKDIQALMDHCDHLVLLPFWQRSKGAKAELAVSRALGYKISYIHDFGFVPRFPGYVSVQNVTITDVLEHPRSPE